MALYKHQLVRGESVLLGRQSADEGHAGPFGSHERARGYDSCILFRVCEGYD